MPIGSSKVGFMGGKVPGGTQTFNSPGTFTVPTGVKLLSSVVGTGGSGNAGTAGNAGAGGGGGGGGSGGTISLLYIAGCAGYPWPGDWGSHPQGGRFGARCGLCSGKFGLQGNAGNPGPGAGGAVSGFGGGGGGGTTGSNGNAGAAGSVGTATTGFGYTWAAGNGGTAGNGGSGGTGAGGGNAGCYYQAFLAPSYPGNQQLHSPLGMRTAAAGTPGASYGGGGNGGTGGAGKVVPAQGNYLYPSMGHCASFGQPPPGGLTGGVGGSGGAGAAGTAGNPGTPGNAGTTTPYSSVAVTPGGTYPIVATGGGSVAITWLSQ